MSCYHRSGCYHGWPSQSQSQDQTDIRAQVQANIQDPDQTQRTVFRDIGNVDIDIDNENILVAVLVVVAVLTGALDATAVRSLLDRVLAK